MFAVCQECRRRTLDKTEGRPRRPLRRGCLGGLAVAALLPVALLAAAASALAQSTPLDHIRGEIRTIDGASMDVSDGARVFRVRLSEQTTILALSPTTFTDVDFGVYVGSVSEKMDDRYSPIYRDSLSWLHRGLELRIIDESLRGIALGHMQWDLTPVSVMTHGWVDDLEVRVISIKYGPTEAEETDVEIGRDLTILRMTLGSRALLTTGAHVFIGAAGGGAGETVAAFIMVGENGVVPRL